MNITMIVPYFQPEITAIVSLMEDLAHDFEEYGATVTVITGFPIRGLDSATRKEYFNKEKEQISNNLQIIRVGSKRDEGHSLWGRGLRYLVKTYVFYHAAKGMPADAYYIYSTPPSAGIIGALMSKKVPTLYCLQDIFPDNLSAQGRIKSGSIIFRVFEAAQAYIYRNNTHIVTISEDMKRNLVEKHVDENKISVIGNWIDTDELKYIPRDQNYLFDQLGLERSGFYVSYCGNLGYAQDIEVILECAKITLRIKPDIHYIIVGSGACEAVIRKRILEEKIENVHLFPLRPEKESAYVYSLGDVGLVTLKKNMSGYAMPSKTWAMMSASQPMICTAEEGSELSEIIRRSKTGKVIQPSDHEALAHEVAGFYEDRDQLHVCGTNGRLYAVKKLSRKGATKQYYDLLSEIAGKTHA